eukprot:GEMP01017488.1.p1 GENE.GEMP01017488.1~~GEMP01017488.1.p1  ORF type:complete len:632 (+),score=172.47 GEMP01017488.1:196-2091(+)
MNRSIASCSRRSWCPANRRNTSRNARRTNNNNHPYARDSNCRSRTAQRPDTSHPRTHRDNDDDDENVRGRARARVVDRRPFIERATSRDCHRSNERYCSRDRWARPERRRPFRDDPWEHGPTPLPVPKRRRTSRSMSAIPPTRVNQQTGCRVAYFLMGTPGCGKSTVKRERFGACLEELTRDFDLQCSRQHTASSSSRAEGEEMPMLLDINPDKLKSFHPLYQACGMTQMEDSTVHSWSVRTSARLVEQICQSGARDFVLDSSGANPRWMLDRIMNARGKYKVHLIFVDCPLEIALFRNRTRGALGDGWVPEEVLIDKAGKVHHALQQLIAEVDVVDRVWTHNSKKTEDADELRQAQFDMYCYPAPRMHPPARPGDDDYAKTPSGACPPSRQPGSRRILRLANWKRSEHVAELKQARLQWIDNTQESREAFIVQDVFNGGTAPHLMVFERNKFPYMMPDRVEHWTLWAYQHLSHRAICDYVEHHLRTKRPDVVSWNYDDNEDRRTVDIDHVHVFLSTRHDKVSMAFPAPSPEEHPLTMEEEPQSSEGIAEPGERIDIGSGDSLPSLYESAISPSADGDRGESTTSANEEETLVDPSRCSARKNAGWWVCPPVFFKVMVLGVYMYKTYPGSP